MTALAAVPRARLSFWNKLVYAAGNTGNVIGYQLVTTYVLRLYAPPDDKGTALIPAFLAGAIPTYLLLNLVARGFDTFWDPIVANWSDRSKHRLGRRRAFMIAGVFPLALTAGLIFFPPTAATSLVNVVWLGAMLTAYYAMFSVYVAPYLALLPEIAPDKQENTSLSTLLAAAALLGALGVMVVAPALFLGKGGNDRVELQTMAGALALLSFVLMLLPVVFLDERRLVIRAEASGAEPSHLGLVDSLRATFADRAFLTYVLGYTLYFFAFNMISTGVPFYVEVLMGRPLAEVGKLLGPMFGVAALAFPLLGGLTRRFSKKGTMIASSLVFGGLMTLLPWVHDVRLGMVIFALAGVPVAIFMAIPNAILADVCEASTRRTGQRREAMFFGAQGFLQKISLGVSTGVFQWVKDALGSSTDKPLGVQVTGPLATAILVLAALTFARYPEARVTKEMEGAG
ncbi:MFS transporter [Polyangium sorediatum]|uniref:MFS transporter n=1 Tax=Polyangium sorediatum TaxID=889274 RepID=A0ABT6P9Y9_9BACT|nr:MFS transporter [Polyangium sorediatum]MDI1437358.1 MFS transporter [Polyangium sorediatum]